MFGFSLCLSISLDKNLRIRFSVIHALHLIFFAMIRDTLMLSMCTALFMDIFLMFQINYVLAIDLVTLFFSVDHEISLVAKKIVFETLDMKGWEEYIN